MYWQEILERNLGKKSRKEISERNWTKKEEPRRNQNLIHVFVISSYVSQVLGQLLVGEYVGTKVGAVGVELTGA